MTSHLLVPIIAGVLMFASALSAQQVGRDEYHAHLPPMPPRVGQTAASVQFALYGDISDPRYRDRVPVDGIDDTRALLLRRLAARFSPILRRNNFSAPMDFRTAMGGRPVLQIDTWSMGRRVATDSVLLYRPVETGGGDGQPGGPCAGEEPAAAGMLDECDRSDAVLAKLLAELHPDVGESRFVAAERPEEKVLFFDFPGEDERSWREAYKDQRDSRIYAHFFVNEDSDRTVPERYAFVIQYWLFYPFNDGPNNHEGDWELLVVQVTTPKQAQAEGVRGGRLDEHDVRRILAGGELADSLVIHAVEYYFHESVYTVDYLAAARAPQHTRWQELAHLHIWEQPDFMTQVVADRLSAHGGRLATHPVAFIGGNSKGPDELLALRPRFGGSFNRNPHGTYPFPGTWQGVGALGSTERVAGELVPRLRAGSDSAADAPLTFVDDHVVSYGEGDILLLPDWERLKDLALVSAAVRREWSWILLPIRWGYPATASPGGGALQHVDLGQIAPEGPMYQSTWNRLATATGRHQFNPRVLRVMTAPVTPWDRIENGWGVLNVPRILLGFLPGWSVVVSQLGPWLSLPLEAVGADGARTFAPARRPHRFTSASVGRHWQFGGAALARMLPPADHPSIVSRNGGQDAPDLDSRATELDRGAAEGLRVSVNIFYGPRLSVQNVYTRSRSRITSELGDDENGVALLEAELELQELLGGFRYRLAELGSSVELFGGGGWGWTWYDVDQVTFAGQPLGPDTDGHGGYGVTIYPSKKWWPNTWYGTVGLELAVPRSAWLFERVGYGVEVQYTGLLHRLGATGPGEKAIGSLARRELSLGFVTSW